jgi:large subunit ribosomal protein L19
MDSNLVKAIQAQTEEGQTMSAKDDNQNIETGMEVEVHQIIKDGEKERIQLFRGLVIMTKGASAMDRCITVRADLDGIGIEKIFPVNSPYIAKIVVLRRFKVRRNKIGYIRELTGKAARLKEIK